MCSDQSLCRQTGPALQRVDVLRVAAQEDAPVVEHPDEVVRRRWGVPAWPDLPHQLVEWPGVPAEEVQVEDRLRCWQVEALEVAVEPRARTPEVGYPCGGRYSGPAHHDNAPALALQHVPSNALQVEARQHGAQPPLLLRRCRPPVRTPGRPPQATLPDPLLLQLLEQLRHGFVRLLLWPHKPHEAVAPLADTRVLVQTALLELADATPDPRPRGLETEEREDLALHGEADRLARLRPKELVATGPQEALVQTALEAVVKVRLDQHVLHLLRQRGREQQLRSWPELLSEPGRGPPGARGTGGGSSSRHARGGEAALRPRGMEGKRGGQDRQAVGSGPLRSMAHGGLAGQRGMQR
mmetsp:Transcript_57296/g.179959  ORF Transcript_57296/g.179959 Transcript_57296/m.179959 type:complete len:354 (+) Transcript_57296:695-1756(+)